MIKQLIKKIVKSESLQDSLRLVYNSAKTLSPELLKEEMKCRAKGLPDGFPYPPSKLIFTIIAIPWVSEFYKSGKIIFDDMSAMLAEHKIELPEKANVLDFGCGCGRIIRHFAAQNKYNLFGSDLNHELISWCDKNLTFGKFTTNNLVPPLSYENNFFDLIYARSVFTHLGKELQLVWICELKRILKPGGLLYFTTHGKVTIAPLNKTEQEQFNRNEIVLHNSFGEGDNKYSSYQSHKWTTENLLDGFELAGYQEGNENPHLRQDVYIFSKL
ncbi:MAG: class I SAM-dependent methyltransferase [Ignavibacteriales bacterium]|nr:class I SAM-dependent methyltransferase [Ignavibacteriales bacterium]